MPCIAGLLVLIIALFLIVIVGVVIVTALSALGIGGASALAVTKYKKKQLELASAKANEKVLPPVQKNTPKEKVVNPFKNVHFERKAQTTSETQSDKNNYKWMDSENI